MEMCRCSISTSQHTRRPSKLFYLRLADSQNSSQDWLGHHSDRARVRKSGLWNQNHVEEAYDPAFLDNLNRLVSNVKAAA
jgi:hypothetical protein